MTRRTTSRRSARISSLLAGGALAALLATPGAALAQGYGERPGDAGLLVWSDTNEQDIMQMNSIWPAGDDRTMIGSAIAGNWSAEGDRLTAWIPNGTGEIITVDPQGSVVQAWQDNAGERAFPALSPDGESVAYSREGVWRGPFNPTLLDEGPAGRISWSSESFEGKLVFDGGAGGGIHIRDLGETRVLVEGKEESLPSIAQNGTTVAFVHTDEYGTKTIRVIDADHELPVDGTDDGSHPLEISAVGDATMPAVSPDGTQVAFVSNRDGMNALYIAPSNGEGTAVRVPNSAAATPVTSLAWQPAIKPVVGPPAITGKVEVYGSVVGQRGGESGTYPMKQEYRWERCKLICTPIPGATFLNYMVTPEDVGYRLRFVETLRSPSGESEAGSQETQVVPPLPDTQGPLQPAIADFAPHLTTSDAVTLTFTGAEPGGTFRCRVDNGEPFECASPQDLGKLSAGWHDVAVWQVDAASNPGEIAEGAFFVAPAGAPKLATVPEALSNDPAPTFSFTGGSSFSTFECALDGGEFAPCSQPYTAPELKDGPHVFEVRETTGTTPSETAKYEWIVDTTAPAKPVVGKAPKGTTAQRTALIELAGEKHARFECQLDGKSPFPAATSKWYACTSPVELKDLADGKHVFLARQVDEAGNAGEQVSVEWTVDTQAPAAPAIKAGPADVTTATTAAFALAGEEHAGFQYKLDGGEWVKTPAAFELTGLAAGPHTIVVRQLDAAGNVSGEVTRTWTVKAVEPPAAPVETPAPAPAPAPAPKPAPKFTATVGDQPAETGNGTRSGTATVTVARKRVDVGCTMTGVELAACKVDLYADVDADGKVHAAARVLVGTGIVEADGKTNKLAVRVVLNAKGRELLRRNPQGLDVQVAITGTPTTGAPIKATGAARLVAKRSTVVIGGFAVDSPTLSAAARTQLRKLAEKLAGGATVKITGHTDGSADSRRYLRTLGLDRARTVKAFLAAHGAKATYTLVTKADTRPRATNATKAGRALNRRVVLQIVR